MTFLGYTCLSGLYYVNLIWPDKNQYRPVLRHGTNDYQICEAKDFVGESYPRSFVKLKCQLLKLTLW